MTHQKQKNSRVPWNPSEKMISAWARLPKILYAWALGISISCGSFASTVQKNLKITELKLFVALKY